MSDNNIENIEQSTAEEVSAEIITTETPEKTEKE